MTTDRRSRRTPHLISIAEGALTLASRHARENLPREVGGVLVGWREGRHLVVVQDLLLVPDDTASIDRYDREHRPADALLQDYLAQANYARLGYVGEWHSHPVLQPPSLIDLRTIRAIASNLRAPVALIVLMAHRRGHSIEPTGRITERGPGSRARVHKAHVGTH